MANTIPRGTPLPKRQLHENKLFRDPSDTRNRPPSPTPCPSRHTKSAAKFKCDEALQGATWCDDSSKKAPCDRKEREEKLERETGIEPATNGLGSRYSTIELLPLTHAKLGARAWGSRVRHGEIVAL